MSTQVNRRPAGAGATRGERVPGLRARRSSTAASILDDDRDADAVTLRAVARAVGIAAPSIYAHFPDREAILDQLCSRRLRQFTATLAGRGRPLCRPC